jgi:hypothetical protein
VRFALGTVSFGRPVSGFVAGVGGAATEVGPGGGVRPTSGATGGGASLPSSAGKETTPAIAAAAIAVTFPTLAHLICLPLMPV